MPNRNDWTRKQLLVAFRLYCQIPFGKLHSHNPEIISYANLIGRTPSALAMKMSNIASLDPAITSTGRRGLSAASSADREMWHEMQNNWERFVIESDSVLSELLPEEQLEEDVESRQEIETRSDYSGEERSVTSKARIGQDFFRRSVLSAYNYRCCITGLSVPGLLIASHIKPWKADVSVRLNPKNGLCLSALHDKAFDAGMITIDEDMTVKVSTKVPVLDNDHYYSNALSNYNGRRISLPDKFQPDVELLDYHRTVVYEKFLRD